MRTYRLRASALASAALLPALMTSPPIAPARRMAPAPRIVTAPAIPRLAYRWPLDPPISVARAFRPPPKPWLTGHRGVDLVADAGVTVRAAGGGTVAFAGQVAGVPIVSVDHAGGLRTTYQPVSPNVTAGQRVAAGDSLGALVAGHAGCPSPGCLHWGLRIDRSYLDPLSLLGVARMRLLPVPPPGRSARAATRSVSPSAAARADRRPTGRTPAAGCRPARRGAAGHGPARR